MRFKSTTLGYLVILTGAGLLIQLIALIGLSQSVRLADESVSIRPNLVKLSNLGLKIAAVAPHRWPEKLLPGNSTATRVLELAETSASALAINPELLEQAVESSEPSSLVTKPYLDQLSTLAVELRIKLDEIESIVQGTKDQPELKSLLGIELYPNIQTAHSALDFAIMAPQLLGCDKPSEVLMLLSSAAEARSLGGLIGQYLRLKFDCGAIDVIQVGANSELEDNSLFDQHLKRYPDLYNGINPEWVNSNLIFDAENLTTAWATAYQQQFATSIDFVMLLDTDLLAVLLTSLGGISAADGTKLDTAAEILAYLENGVYYQFPEDQLARKAHLQQITEEFAQKFTLRVVLQPALIPTYFKVLKQDRILIAATSADHFELNSKLRNLNWSDKSEDTIFVGVNNLSGSKFDFYSTYSLNVKQCKVGSAKLKLTIKNSADPTSVYPDYVNRRLDGYPNLDVGVLNEVILAVPFKGAELFVDQLPALSTSSWVPGEYGYDIFRVVEFISAGERAPFRFRMSAMTDLPLKIRSWGSEPRLATNQTKGPFNCKTN